MNSKTPAHLSLQYRSSGRRLQCTSLRLILQRALFGILIVLFESALAQPNHVVARQIELVSEIPCPDPHVIHDGSDWYIFGTGARPFFLQGKELGEGKMIKKFLELDYAGFSFSVAQIWGFVVHRHWDGSWHAYGTLHLGNFRTVIAYFEPQVGESWEPGKPITKWKFKKLLMGDPARKDWKYYEAKVIGDSDRKNLYLMFTAHTTQGNCIFAQKMKNCGEIDASYTRQLMLKPEGYRSEDRNGRGGLQIVEGGSVFRWGGKYILLYSVGDYLLNNYKLGMAFSDSLIPSPGQTYRKIKLPDPQQIWRADGRQDEVGYFLQSQKPAWPNYIGRSVVGPGLGSIVPVDNQLWLFFHGYKPDDTERNPKDRFVFRVPVAISIRPGPPELSWVRVNISGANQPKQRTDEIPSLRNVLKTGSVWEGVSDWGKGRTTKSELRCSQSTGTTSVWEFVFLEESIFKTPVPFRQKWTGEIIASGSSGAYLQLTRFDGKARHRYVLKNGNDLVGEAIGAAFKYRFKLVGSKD